MNIEVLILILIVSVSLLVLFFYYLRSNQKKNEHFEEELIKEIKFENKLKKETFEKKETTGAPLVDIAEMLDKMQADLEEQKQDKKPDFEQEQEEASIISYSELKRAAKEFTEEEELAQEQSPISVKEVLRLREEEKRITEDPILSMLNKTEINKEESIVEEPKQQEVENKKFKNTDFISPVYGKQEQNQEYPHIPLYHKKDEVLSVIETDKKIKEEETNEAFLNELRDFRRGL